ncbi:unnamed protein product [Sphenostylis stenocarpa]|uniref:S-protein homolog n=1 Tax=Sphenostylis stenocarpa TaxID=92480 RepID=A0AA86VMU9_9FABA|nr:unnamed protein product [Sphenostylis stenocarpa]
MLLMMVNTVQSETQGNGLFGDMKHVRMINDMKEGVLVRLHCRSKNDDLGERVLAFRQHWEWKFNDNVISSTLFWCNMHANNVVRSFRVYFCDDDYLRCNTQCYRSLRMDGAYYYHQIRNVWQKQLSWIVDA